ncbi:MAG: hypothetical protein HKO56_01650, partial [Bacteroidia bacterium]|nr:hypothetical protein [Bacteroidia bacterium]
MKKFYSILACAILFISTQTSYAQISIASARTMSIGAAVTVNGIVTTDAGFGTIRYIQDGTAGIAIFDSQLSGTTRGDSISVTGELDEFNNLLEIVNVSSFTVISSGNALPSPAIITPSMCDETMEGQLAQINNATFNSPVGNFAGNTTYSFTAGGEIGELYIRSSNPLVGHPIPASTLNITGICSQFASSYQLLPRDSNDLNITSLLSFTSAPAASNITSSSFDVNWGTNSSTSAFINYGLTPNLELGVLSGTTSTTNHTVSITGAMPSELYYVQAFSVAGTDTLFGAVQVYITASTSSGDMSVYFSSGVDNSKANGPGNFAVQVNNAFADTIAAYISNANQSVDIAIYNFSDMNTTPIITAINNAHTSGIQVRVITERTNTNSGISQLNANIPVLKSKSAFGFGIMHNKFVVIDEATADPMDDIIITGSTNWTDDQLTIDRNNLVIVQDKSLAIAYTLEFEEMWGSTGATPDSLLARFGPDKLDDTPHLFSIGGK